MDRLPDDLLLGICKLGIENRILDHKDICSLAETCHHFDQITQETDLWAALLAQKFHSSALSDQHASKAVFRTELQKMKQNEREMQESFDEVTEFIMWLDNNFLDEEEDCMNDGIRGRVYIDSDKDLACADTSGRYRYISASTKSFWFTASTVLLPKRHYQ